MPCYAPNSDYSIVSGGVLAEVDLAAETWSSQMGQTLEADGDEYVFAFNIRTEDPALSRTVRLICELDGAPYTKYGTAYCTINGVNTRCATACTPPAGTMTRFSVHGGQSVVDYVVASAELYSANGTPEPTPGPGPVLPGTPEPTPGPGPVLPGTPEPTPGPGPVLPETLEEYFTQTNQADRLAYFGFHGFGEAEVVSRHFLHHMLNEDGLLNVFFTHVRPSSGTTYLESSEFWTNGMDWLYANNIINIAEYDGVFQDVFFNIALRPESRLVIMLAINADVASVNEYTYNWDICVWNDKMVGRARNIALEYAMDEIMTAPRFYSGLDSFKLHSSAWNLTGDGATIEPEEFSIVPIFYLINMAEDFVGPVGGAPSVERWQWVVYPAP